MNETPTPGWYPDPSGQPQLRWWDGTQWTSHTHAAQAPAAPLPSAAPQDSHTGPGLSPTAAAATADSAAAPTRKKTWLFVTAGVAALALLTTGAIAIPAMLGKQNASERAVNAEPVVANGIKYMPAVELDLEKNDSFAVPASVDLTELQNQLIDAGEPVGYNYGILEIYADRELTVPVGPFTYSSPEGSGFSWTVKPLQSADRATKSIEIDDASVPFEAKTFDQELPWSQYSEYWVKRIYGEQGEKLETPEVTQVIPKFRSERPDSISVSFGKGAADGAVKLNWIAPEHADKNTEYLIINSQPSAFSTTGGDYEEWTQRLVAVVQGDTAYDSSEHTSSKTSQNAGLTLFSGDSADVQEFGGEGVWKASRNTTKGRIGVVAKIDGQYSPIELIAPDASVRAQPFEFASFQQFETRDDSQKWNVGDLTGLETWMPVTTLDGSTRSMQVQIDPDSLNPDVVIQNFGENGGFVYPDGVGLSGTVLGTTLTTSYASYVPAGMSKTDWMAQLKTHIENFNARSITDQAKTGAVLLTVEDADHTIDFAEYRTFTAAKDTPKVDFPVFGTHPMVEHIAANMIVGEKAIDVSQWRDLPGSPSPWEAYREATTQNPLINYGRPVVAVDGQKIYIDYVFEQPEREAAMRLSYDRAQEIAATVDGKSDTEKVTEINQWIIDNTVYDFDSFAQYQGENPFGIEGKEPSGVVAYNSEFTAWSPVGVFRDGKAVCMGYAQAFTMIARAAGLESIIVSGDVINAGPHAWNRVNVDGTWKSLDPTWNDSDAAQNQYLLINESDYTGVAERLADPTDNWILEQNKSKYNTP